MSVQAVQQIIGSPNEDGLGLPSVTVQPLTAECKAEVLAFLETRPLHTVFMTGLIHDNGLVSPLNRGTFYGCRDAIGRLQGVALIGHAVLMETRTPEALAAFSRVAQDCSYTHVMMGEEERIEAFWQDYAGKGQTPRLLCRELLLVQRWPVDVREAVPGLRQATLDDLQHLIPVNAFMVFQECGVNPLETDPEGFRQRLVRRIQQGRLWVWVEDGELIFKIDIISDTKKVIYLEGAYVAPQHRGKGYGRRCMSQLSRQLLGRAEALCLLANNQNKAAQAFYRRIGYKLCAFYDTIYLYKESANGSLASAPLTSM